MARKAAKARRKNETQPKDIAGYVHVQKAFFVELECRDCEDVAFDYVRTPATREEAQMSLASKLVPGWKLINGRPICPSCVNANYRD